MAKRKYPQSASSGAPISHRTLAGVAEHVGLEIVEIGSLTENARNARTHSKRQVADIARSIQRFGFTNPILVDEAGVVLAGHGRLRAAKTIGMASVPVLRFAHLSDVEKRAYVLADNKMAERAGWNRELLAIELGELAVLLPTEEIAIDLTGFDIGEIDAILADHASPALPQGPDGADLDVPDRPEVPTTRSGDLWLLGPHRVLCGDARKANDVTRLMEGSRAHMVFLDPPYNVPVAGHVQVGTGASRHREFAFASGEMSKPEFTRFLTEALTAAAAVSHDGALHYVCMDWRHIEEITTAGQTAYTELKNLCVWAKTSPGMGSLYRSQHELIFVYKHGRSPHRNSVELGRHGRSRSNVWTYAGASAFKAGGREELAWHPTVKPVALVADAMRDCTVKGEIVLDTFLGSGTTLMAAARVGRVCRGLEFDPGYVDVAVRRWQVFTGLDATSALTGETYDEIALARGEQAMNGVTDLAGPDVADATAVST